MQQPPPQKEMKRVHGLLGAAQFPQSHRVAQVDTTGGAQHGQGAIRVHPEAQDPALLCPVTGQRGSHTGCCKEPQQRDSARQGQGPCPS